MRAESACDGVLLVGFGGPTAPAEIRPFLDRVLKGRPVPPERYEQVVRHYQAMGGRSPYNELTMRQADALRAALRRQRLDLPVAVGMRNSPPFIDEALRDLAERGVRRALGFILAAYRCEASWERYQQDVAQARDVVGSIAPAVEYPGCWHDHPLFVAAVADRVLEAAARLDANGRSAELIFTAHSIPVAMAARAPYVAQLNESARLVAAAAGFDHWTLAFQSRSGNPRESWLEPDIGAALRKLSGAAIVMPLGFLCDHIEVLYDLDIEAARVVREAGVRMERAATVSDHPEFVEMMASIVRTHVVGS
ncbi:MAG TPA: ferrochelatase [Candidatus Binataceae bacterium]|nr:ferrochelatase [Candidatus Binataceae bacterium]